MAIHPEYPGLEVTVDVDGQAMLEYRGDDDEDTPAHCTNYVEAISGKEFGFGLQIDQHAYPYANCHFLIKFCVDGRRVKTKDLTSQEIYARRPGKRSIFNGVYERIGHRAFIRPLIFSDLKMTEDDATDRFGNLKELGTIKAECFIARERFRAEGHGLPFRASHQRDGARRPRTQGLQLPPADTPPEHEIRPYSTIEGGSVPEKCLKGQAVSHQTTYGRGVPQPPPMPFTHELKPYGRPIAVFVFKYRSHAALNSLLVLPKSPSPPPEDPIIEDWDTKEVLPFERQHTVAPPKSARKRTFDDTEAHDEDSEASEELTWEDYQTKRARLIDEAEVVQLD